MQVPSLHKTRLEKSISSPSEAASKPTFESELSTSAKADPQ
jgi:hypothetical protein